MTMLQGIAIFQNVRHPKALRHFIAQAARGEIL